MNVEIEFLKTAKRLTSGKGHPKDFPYAFKIIVNQLIKQTQKLNKLEISMDKKMHKVTEKMRSAEKDVKAGKSKAAVHVLKGAEKKNEKLVKMDKNVRDPMIDKFKKAKKAMC